MPAVQRSLSIGGVTRHSRKQHSRRQRQFRPYTVSGDYQYRKGSQFESSAEPKNTKLVWATQVGASGSVNNLVSPTTEGQKPRLQCFGSITIGHIEDMMRNKLNMENKNEEDSAGNEASVLQSVMEVSTKDADNIKKESPEKASTSNYVLMKEQTRPKDSRKTDGGNNNFVHGGAIPKRAPLRTQNENRLTSLKPPGANLTAPVRMPNPNAVIRESSSFLHSFDFCGESASEPLKDDTSDIYDQRFEDNHISSPSFEDTVYFYDQDVHPFKSFFEELIVEEDKVKERKLRKEDTLILPSPETDDEYISSSLQELFGPPKLAVLGHIPKEFLCFEDKGDDDGVIEEESDDDSYMQHALKTSNDKASYQNLLTRTTQFKCAMCSSDLEICPDRVGTFDFDDEFTDLNANFVHGSDEFVFTNEIEDQTMDFFFRNYDETELFCSRCGCRRGGYYKED